MSDSKFSSIVKKIVEYRKFVYGGGISVHSEQSTRSCVFIFLVLLSAV